MTTDRCSQCGCLFISDNPNTYGCNIPDVTPGPVYLCNSCCPPGTAAEVIESILRFCDPKKEPGR
jgi:hypothetical protein